MALISLRTLTNSDSAVEFDASDSSLSNRFFAEDFNLIKDAIQLAKYGIKTKDLETTGSITVGSDVDIADALTVTGASTFEGTATFNSTSSFSDNITIASSKTVDGVDVSTLQTLSENLSGGQIPLWLIEGAYDSPQAAWVTHDHATDGSPQIDTPGIADGAVTPAKLDATVFGTTAGTAFEGNEGNALQSGVLTLFNPESDNVPIGKTFISPFEMGQAIYGNDSDEATFTELVSNPFGSSLTQYMTAVRVGGGSPAATGARFQDVIRDDYGASIALRFLYGHAQASPGASSDHDLIVDITMIPFETELDDSSPSVQFFTERITLASLSNDIPHDQIFHSESITIPVPEVSGVPVPCLLSVRFRADTFANIGEMFIFGAILSKVVNVAA